MLIWLENAPIFGIDEDEDVTAFIDKIITSSKPDNDSKLPEMVKDFSQILDKNVYFRYSVSKVLTGFDNIHYNESDLQSVNLRHASPALT